MMKTSTKRVTAVLQAFLCVTFACSMSFAGPVIQGTTTMKICPDPSAALVIAKSLSQGTGKLTLKATICNKGPGNYTGVDPLQAHFSAITRYKPGEMGVIKSINTIAIQGMKNGECRDIPQTYTIPNVVMWGHTFPSKAATMRPAEQEIKVQIENKYGSIGIKHDEDCNTLNNAASEKVTYMEKL